MREVGAAASAENVHGGKPRLQTDGVGPVGIDRRHHLGAARTRRRPDVVNLTPMHTAKRWTKRLGILLLALVVLAGAFGVFTVRRSFPQVDGVATVPNLGGEVSVVRDEVGVPHIYAGSSHDLYMAQGFVHAQERFFQMDFWRHIGAARLSEMFGDSTIDTDRFLRTLQLVAIAEEEFAGLSSEDRAVLEAYAEGVNAYLSQQSGAALSLEYAVLGLTNRSYEPEPWTPIDTMTWAKMMSWDLGSNMDRELSRALGAGVVGVDRVEELWPPYPDDQPVIVDGGSAAAETPHPPLALLPNESLTDLAQQIERVRDLTGVSGAEIGSNNWVVAGSKTETGAPILANDPHLSIQMPSIWFQVALHCVGTADGCPLDVAGFSFPGTPGVVIGHNDHIAWGVTNLAPDTQDLVIEKINPANPHQYEVNGAWVDMEVKTEEIVVAGGPTETLETRWTRHGPIISDTFGGLEDFDEAAAGVEVPDSHGVALRWTSLQPTRLVESILDLNRATNWEEFRRAVSTWDIAAQNFVYADIEGNIGYQATGLTPIRSDGDGRWPVPGWTDQFSWSGMVPFEELPSLYNPPSGFIVTANNAVVDDSYPYLLTSDWAYGYRAERIEEALAQNDSVTVEFMNQLQNDAKNVHAGELVPVLLEVPADTEAVRSVQEVLREWSTPDGSLFGETLQNRVDSAGAAAYNATWRHLLIGLLDEFDPEVVSLTGRDRMFVVVNELVSDPTNAWWDIAATDPTEVRDDILGDAMENAFAELADRFGEDPTDWRWGALHTAEFRNGTLGESGIAPIEALFNRGPFEVGGGTSIVNAMSWSPIDGYEVLAIPSMRMVVDMSDFDASTAIHSTGQSGHAFGAHYIDMAEPWATGETFPMLWSETAVRTDSENVLTLTPG